MKVWRVRVEWTHEDGGPMARIVEISDGLVQKADCRSDHTDKDIADQITALRLAEMEIAGLF